MNNKIALGFVGLHDSCFCDLVIQTVFGCFGDGTNRFWSWDFMIFLVGDRVGVFDFGYFQVVDFRLAGSDHLYWQSVFGRSCRRCGNIICRGVEG